MSNKFGLFAGVAMASLLANSPYSMGGESPKTKQSKKNDYVPGPSKDVRKKRKAVKKARRRNRK